MMLDPTALKRHREQLLRGKELLDREFPVAVNRIADRHFARTVQGTDVGDSPDSPSLRNRWDRTPVVRVKESFTAEVFNPLPYASWYEFGHRQLPGRIVFIELRPGVKKYGQIAHEYKGKWGIFVRQKAAFVKGKFVLSSSELAAQKELDRAAIDLWKALQKELA